MHVSLADVAAFRTRIDSVFLNRVSPSSFQKIGSWESFNRPNTRFSKAQAPNTYVGGCSDEGNMWSPGMGPQDWDSNLPQQYPLRTYKSN